MIKYLMIALVVVGLNGCNTMIGMGRDTRQAYDWTKSKVQGD